MISHKASCVQCGWRWVFESYSETTLHKMAAYHQARKVGHEIEFTKKE